jgi:hypothetical protein
MITLLGATKTSVHTFTRDYAGLYQMYAKHGRPRDTTTAR